MNISACLVFTDVKGQIFWFFCAITKGTGLVPILGSAVNAASELLFLPGVSRIACLAHGALEIVLRQRVRRVALRSRSQIPSK
jgi:hypothetical protein